MTFGEYQQATAATAIYPPEKGLEYCALKLAEELEELYDAIDDNEPQRIFAELGDCCWYVWRLFHHLGYDGSVVDDYKGTVWDERRALHKLQGVIGKAIRDGMTEQKRVNARIHLLTVWEYIADTAELNGGIRAVLAANLAKLRDRAERGVIQGSGDDR